MESHQAGPYRPQNVHEVAEMIRGLENSKGKGKGRDKISCKKSTFSVVGSSIKVDSWKMQDWDYKKENLPTYARGLFTTRNSKGNPEIAVRGYDKFFNHGEVRETEWQNVEANTRGPYELSVKENGCIIFISGLEDGTLIVCSKHSTGPRDDVEKSHACAGERWVERHVASVGKTKQDLALHLRQLNVTAVAELCDDAFEEHVLAYTPETAGLYLHGLNLNLPVFSTYPHHLVDQFAEEWGFKKTTFLLKHDINDVKVFLDHVAETGNFEGRDTEGFVIRCQSKANTGEWHDWFFKYKFEEPYLMYRQWRECTKHMIAGRAPKYRKHKKITEEYLIFAKKQLLRNPQLAKEYNANHGIIKLRDDFLASRGLKGSDIIRQEEEEGEVANDVVSRDVILVPIATIGCGKTTVSLALCKLFDWGHVQNDNITVKKGKPQVFANTCVQQLATYPAMVADRNNHQRRERKQLIDDVSAVAPGVRFVALQYVHERGNYDNIRDMTRYRVLNRGDNHQTIQATSKGSDQVIEIMEGFMHRFESVDTSTPPDDGFDLVIDLDVLSDSRENLETAVTKLYAEYPKLFENREMPSSDDMDAAIEAALNNYTVDLKHEITGHGGRSNKVSNKQPAHNATPAKPKERKVEYFGVQISAPRIEGILDNIFKDQPADVAKMYRALKSQRRVQQEFHVTLIHRTAAQGPHAALWEHLSALYAEKAAPTPDRNYSNPQAALGTCKVWLERLVWDTRLMAFVVRLSPTAPDGEHFRTVNAVAHVTVGTMSPDIKPKESNDLLATWLRDGSGVNGIQELMVQGGLELEGTVKAVLAR